MSSYEQVLKKLTELITVVNAINANAKKIDELPVQDTLEELSKIHVSNGGVSEKISIRQLLDVIPNPKHNELMGLNEGAEYLHLNQSQKDKLNNISGINTGDQDLSPYALIVDVNTQIDAIKTILNSDNVNLDTVQEIVDAIENVQISLSTILVNDLVTGGTTKALTAEMGKVLQNTKLEGVIATDAETQISNKVTEDNKVVSRLKLLNWWSWNKTINQSMGGTWSFNGGLRIGLTGIFSSDTSRVYIRSTSGKNIYIGASSAGIDAIDVGSGGVTMRDLFVLMSGTESKPAFILPNGIGASGGLTTVPQNGAIERDNTGVLWETHGGVRSRITSTTNGSYLPVVTPQVNVAEVQTEQSQWVSNAGSLYTVCVRFKARANSGNDLASFRVTLPFAKNGARITGAIGNGVIEGLTVGNPNKPVIVEFINSNTQVLVSWYAGNQVALFDGYINFQYLISE